MISAGDSKATAMLPDQFIDRAGRAFLWMGAGSLLPRDLLILAALVSLTLVVGGCALIVELRRRLEGGQVSFVRFLLTQVRLTRSLRRRHFL